jgi:hypothetical protein
MEWDSFTGLGIFLSFLEAMDHRGESNIENV